jgi:glycosyltransferase involved in cell wall biosynthesis
MKKDQPLVSIVTSSFNQAHFLGQTMQSVFNQSYPHIEYIITDAGSTDGSVEIIKKYADRLHYWHSERDLGPADGLRKGFQHARGEILAWLNSDDLLAENAVENAVTEFSHHPEADLVYGNRAVIDGKGRLLYWRPSLPCMAQTPYIATILPQETCFFRRQSYFAAGGLNAEMRFAFDYDLFSKIARRGKLVYSSDIWGFFRKHESSLTMLQFRTTGRREVRSVQARTWGRQCGYIKWTLAHLLVKAYALASTPFSRKPAWPQCLPPMRKIGFLQSFVASLHETSWVKKFLKRFVDVN